MSKTCKYCGKPFERIGTLRDFCSMGCKTKCAKEKYLKRLRKHRLLRKHGQKSRIERETLLSGSIVLGGQSETLILPTESRVYRSKKSESETLKTLYHEWAEKECSNYREAKKTGFCVSLTEPYMTWSAHTCDECEIAISSLGKEVKRKKVNVNLQKRIGCI